MPSFKGSQTYCYSTSYSWTSLECLIKGVIFERNYLPIQIKTKITMAGCVRPVGFLRVYMRLTTREQRISMLAQHHIQTTIALLSIVLKNRSFAELTNYCPLPNHIDWHTRNIFQIGLVDRGLFMCISEIIEKDSVILPVFCAVLIWTSNIQTPPKVPHSKTILARYLGKCDLS